MIQIGHKKIAGDDLSSAYVLKDNYMFGLKEIAKEKSEFWLRFENGTRLKVHMQNKKNSENTGFSVIKNLLTTPQRVSWIFYFFALTCFTISRQSCLNVGWTSDIKPPIQK